MKEEIFIIDQVRVRREMLGDDSQPRRNQNNDWVIRPRKKSVGLSDDEMDIDSDATAVVMKMGKKTATTITRQMGGESVRATSASPPAGPKTTNQALMPISSLPISPALTPHPLPHLVLKMTPTNPIWTRCLLPHLRSPCVSPGPRSLRPITALLSSPGPADILAGRVFWESDEPDDDDGTPQKGTDPLKGCFLPNSETRTAIIDDSHKGVPSPHPSFRRDKSRRFNVRLFAYHDLGERGISRFVWYVGAKVINLDHPFHLLAVGLVCEKEFDERMYVRRFDGDIDAGHEWHFESELTIPVKVQVEGSTDLEHGDKRDVWSQGSHEFLDPLGML